MSFEYDASLYCEACDGSGEIEYDTGAYDRSTGEPDYVVRKCKYCGGTGYLAVHVRPIDFEDLAKIAGDEADD